MRPRLRRRTRIAHGAVLCVLAATAAGCGAEDDPTPAPAATAVGSPSPTAGPSTAPSRVLLALRDNGSTVTVSRTSMITLSLPSTHRWSTPDFTGARATASEVVSDAPSGGQLFEVVAHETGRGALRSTGRPACRPGPSCPAGDVSYEVVLDVRS